MRSGLSVPSDPPLHVKADDRILQASIERWVRQRKAAIRSCTDEVNYRASFLCFFLGKQLARGFPGQQEINDEYVLFSSVHRVNYTHSNAFRQGAAIRLAGLQSAQFGLRAGG